MDAGELEIAAEGSRGSTDGGASHLCSTSPPSTADVVAETDGNVVGHATDMTTISQLPASDRPRERLLREGPGALSDAELLALLLGSGTRGRNVLASAQDLLATTGGVATLAGRRPEELRRADGIGDATAARIVAAFELGRRTRHEPTMRPVLSTSVEIAGIAARMIGDARKEHLLVLVADVRLRLQHIETVTVGTLDGASAARRDVLGVVLRHDGATFALAHNHPSGDPTPSSADRAATASLRSAAQQVGVRFLDHIVVAGSAWRSVTASR